MALKNPILSNPIAVDIPKLNEILDALSKANPTDVDGISTGAMRLYEVSSGKWQWQEYNGSTWAAVPFLQHSVDQLDGYHAAITPAANTVAVRNASGLLEDSIAGNAATASSAATLSQTLPVNKGGTGATTSEAARSNLGVPPTSHASANTTHGVGNATQYGHLKLSDATNSSSGVSGGVAATPAAVKAAKDAADAAQSSANNAMTKASTLATASSAGIVKPGTGMTVNAAGALNANASSSTTPGLVKSSVTALAGAAPLGGADGALDEGWLKPAMEAIENIAQQAAVMFNTRTVIETSTVSWKAPVTGTYKITCIGGGGGGGGSTSGQPGTDNWVNGGGGGGQGGTSVKTVDLAKDDVLKITIGAGGVGGTGNQTTPKNGKAGGTTTVTGTGISITAGGGGGGVGSRKGLNSGGAGGTGDYATGMPGGSGESFYPYRNNEYAHGGSGGGEGGGIASTNKTTANAKAHGAGGAGGTGEYTGNANDAYPGGDGHAGCVIIEYYDPKGGA